MMSEFLQTVLVSAALVLALGFIVFRLSAQSKALVMNGHSHGDKEVSCSHCHPENGE